ncbi:hypothetical protein pdam_00013189 [Pocillopora damicornis]|uniref:Uncharacterized protein n=1 Tax=Pocillopora damicornis TaxID=46731 RepID=A0A3M6ULL8_POCDA|nr:hypothetical protein pdam_00013189 [Pocillopora damicornis]
MEVLQIFIREEAGSNGESNIVIFEEGLIDDGEDTFYITPESGKRETGAHKVVWTRQDEATRIRNNCGNKATHADSHYSDEKSRPFSRIPVRRSVLGDIDEFYKPFLTTSKTRYNEVLMVVDFGMYLKYNNDTDVIKDRVITLANAVDAIYQRINIRVVVKGLEIWTNGEAFERQKTGGADLSRFNTYRKEILEKTIPHDNAQLLSRGAASSCPLLFGFSDWSWSDCAGMAFVMAMCGSVSSGVNNWDYGSIIGPYVTVAHEMGHNFGFSHDTGSCKCLTPRGCIMGGHKTRVAGFSNCSLTQLQKLNDWCLYNVPSYKWDYGNIIGPYALVAHEMGHNFGFNHDTGFSNCSLTQLQKLNDWCLFNVPSYKSANGYCGNGIREEGEECDCGTPEMCELKDPCCQPYKCVLKRESQCSDLHHSCCENCLFKKQGSLCREVETDCDVPEYCTGDYGDCPGDTYIIDGYPCSQTKTVILGNTNHYSVEIRPLSPRVYARYLRINPQYWKDWPCLRTEFLGCSTDEGRSLKHLKSNKCIHTYGAWPGVDRHMVLWSGCDEKRLEIWFAKQECINTLGMQSGDIKDSQITASSYRPADLPHYGRLHNGKYWCAKEKKRDEYIQIDLGQLRTVNKILIQGRGNWYDWVTGFFLYYSDDGQRWTGYSESGDKQHSNGRGNWYDWVTGFFLYYSDDGQRWTGYSESGDKQHSNSHCYQGKCSEIHETQCKDLWGATAKNADERCYNMLNTKADGYGTCDPLRNVSCAARNVLCGQLQCEDSRDKPVVDYGWTYTKISMDNGKQCSAATLKSIDDIGEGMVREGTKCGDDKMCVDNQCQTFDSLNVGKCPVMNNKECGGRGMCVDNQCQTFDSLNFGKCPVMNNKECGGRGVCTNKKVCHCEGAFDSKDGCASALVPRDGAWGDWSSWTVCDKLCDGGKRKRHRFCDNPFPLHGGADCSEKRHETEDCNTQSCPKVISCRHLQQVGEETNHNYPDAVYKIYPTGSQPIMAYCDMSRDGGGWTLLVTSHTNSWMAQNVKLRNANSPKLTDDYSILQYADSIKDNIKVAGSTFEYRLEAQSRGRWGGIWKAPRVFTFTADNNKQTDIELVKKFDNWEYSDYGIEQRMPWISDAKLTTSQDAQRHWWGTITSDDMEYYPAPWINGHLQERRPSYIWYWMREGPHETPSSCKEVYFRGLLTNPVSIGFFAIKPPGQHEVKTYCDFTTEGGPWTLLVTSKTHSGWDKDSIKERNSNKPSLQDDYSILGLADAIKDFDKAQEFFQYRIEADGNNRWGGIWEAPRDYTFLSTSDKQTKVKIVKKFDSWDENSNLGKRMPRLGLSNDLLLSSAATVNNLSGSLAYNSGASSASYLEPEKPKPNVVRYWMREGASYLIFTKKEGTVCNATDQIFVLDQDGVIYHKCSKKVVCPQDNNPTNWKKLMLKDKCDLSISRHVRLPTHNNLKNLKNDFCVHPNGGWPGEGVHLLYWPGCGEERLKLNFFELGKTNFSDP